MSFWRGCVEGGPAAFVFRRTVSAEAVAHVLLVIHKKRAQARRAIGWFWHRASASISALRLGPSERGGEKAAREILAKGSGERPLSQTHGQKIHVVQGKNRFQFEKVTLVERVPMGVPEPGQDEFQLLSGPASAQIAQFPSQHINPLGHDTPLVSCESPLNSVSRGTFALVLHGN